MATVYYIGDSTVAFNKIDSCPQQGMSNALGLYLAESVRLEPHGLNGRSTKSYLDEGGVCPRPGRDEGGGLPADPVRPQR